MKDKILLGRDQHILEIPQTLWKQHLEQAPQHSQARLSFMTAAHQQVRYFVVRELVHLQKPLTYEHAKRIYRSTFQDG